MKVLHTIKDIRTALAGEESIGFVPTMGALHNGHLSLLQEARRENNQIVLSIFVNPTQFGPQEDFSRYPRTLENDLALAEKAGVDFVFCPSVEEVYPKNWNTFIEVEGVSQGLCGQFRPGHFRGVATVVYRLFQIIQPSTAYFGQKDLQQFFVIQKMAENLWPDIKIKMVPTLREADGLAMSSRNRYLSDSDRVKATIIFRALNLALKNFAKASNPHELELLVSQELSLVPEFKVQYAELRSLPDLAPPKDLHGDMAFLIAGYFGATRLIDNVLLRASPRTSISDKICLSSR